jgi:plastocyanin
MLKDVAFAPSSITVAVGTTVVWSNQDTIAHTVTADDASFDSGPLRGDQSFRQTFSKAGTIAYHCSIHRAMKGTVVVQ